MQAFYKLWFPIYLAFPKILVQWCFLVSSIMAFSNFSMPKNKINVLTLFFAQQSFSSEKKIHFTGVTAVSYKIISVEIKYPSKLHILPSSQFDIICHRWSNNILILNISANSQMTYLRFHAVQSILQVSCIFAESQNKHNHKSNKMYIKKLSS